MNSLLYAFAGTLLLGGALTSIAIWSPRRLWIKTGAIGIVTLFLPTSYVALAELLSRPKPIHLEWRHDDLAEAAVLGVDLREGEAIYLWLKIQGVADPRSYVLAWDQYRAQQLYDAQREAESKGTEVRMRQPFEPGEDEPLFYAKPQVALPPKQPPAEPVATTAN